MQDYNRRRLGETDNDARKEALRAIQMKLAWDFGFRM